MLSAESFLVSWAQQNAEKELVKYYREVVQLAREIPYLLLHAETPAKAVEHGLSWKRPEQRRGPPPEPVVV